MSTVEAALSWARQRIPAAEARLLLGHCLRRDSAWLVAHGEAALDAQSDAAYAALVARRAAGEPVAYLAGQREFYGREFAVTSGVLIPRPETELLVDLALAAMRSCAAPRVLDLGTGSGCLAVTLALELPQAELTAVDVSVEALAIAQANAARLGARVRFLRSDWFAALGDERFDLIVSNPPYIAANDPHLVRGDLRFEPPGALVSGNDGLDAIRGIVRGARAHVNPGASLLVEHGYDQADAVRGVLLDAGWQGIGQHRDLAGIVRVTGGSP